MNNISLKAKLFKVIFVITTLLCIYFASDFFAQKIDKSYYVKVSGAVEKEGIYEIKENESVSSALQQAKLKPNANLSKLDLDKQGNSQVYVPYFKNSNLKNKYSGYQYNNRNNKNSNITYHKNYKYINTYETLTNGKKSQKAPSKKINKFNISHVFYVTLSPDQLNDFKNSHKNSGDTYYIKVVKTLKLNQNVSNVGSQALKTTFNQNSINSSVSLQNNAVKSVLVSDENANVDYSVISYRNDNEYLCAKYQSKIMSNNKNQDSSKFVNINEFILDNKNQQAIDFYHKFLRLYQQYTSHINKVNYDNIAKYVWYQRNHRMNNFCDLLYSHVLVEERDYEIVSNFVQIK